MSLLYLNASHREERGEPDSSNFIINLPNTYLGVSNVELLLFNIPNSIRNVRQGINDTIVFTLPLNPTPYVPEIFIDENTAKDYVIRLDEGFYSARDLMNAIQLKSQEVFTDDGRSENIKIELDEIDNRLTFSEENDLCFRINGNHPSYNIDSELIGTPYNFNKYGGKTFWNKEVKLPNAINMAIKTVFLTILLNDNSGYDVMSADGSLYSSFVVPIDNVWSAIVWGKGFNKISFKYPINISRLRVKWLDYKGRPLKLDTSWEVILSLS